jgi:putative sterol carrier protein
LWEVCQVSEQVETPEQDRTGEQVGGADEPAEGQQPAGGDAGANGAEGQAPAGAPASAEDLAAMLDGRSDDEVTAFVKAAGYDTVLGQIFSEMQARFLPEKAAGRTAVIQYDINTPDGAESYQAVIADGACQTRKGGDGEPSVTLVLSLPDFLRLISGKLNGVQAFMSGKLKIRGDMMLAQTMQGWFDQA